jgi:hypothetical protein
MAMATAAVGRSDLLVFRDVGSTSDSERLAVSTRVRGKRKSSGHSELKQSSAIAVGAASSRYLLFVMLAPDSQERNFH